MKPTAHYWLWGSLLAMSLLWLTLFGGELWQEQDIPPLPSSALPEPSPALPSTGSLGLPHAPPGSSAGSPHGPQTSAQTSPHGASPFKGIVFIIDDMGESLQAAQELLRLPFPVTLSIWPHSRHARQTAELAHAAGREVFIHLPMQPLGARKDAGPGLLMENDSPQHAAALVQKALRSVPHAVGINNHMGSRATTHSATAALFCEVVRPTGLIVLDSVTHQASLLYTTARKHLLPALRRDIFLDHTQNRPAVLAQLEKARRLAHKQDIVVVIGHPHAVTLEALRQWGPPPDVTVITTRQAALGAGR